MLKIKNEAIEIDGETSVYSYESLLKNGAICEGRNLVANLHLTNYSLMIHLFGWQYASHFIVSFVNHLRHILPADTIISRANSDKFVIVFPGMVSPVDCEAFKALLENVFLYRLHTEAGSEKKYSFNGNAGLALETLTKERLSAVASNAGLARHYATQQMNGAALLFSPQMRDEALMNLRLEEYLSKSIYIKEFYLVMQPIVTLANSRLYNEGECLLRRNSPELGFVPPDKIISIAEKTGFMIPLGRWIIETACKELSDFIARGAADDFKLHINISAIQIQQPDFCEHLFDCIKHHGLSNSNICIEITESIILKDMNDIVIKLNHLRTAGITVAIDDFGSGFSSLSYLHKLPFDCLKIDRGFVRDLLENRKSEAVVSSVLNLAKNFNVPLVAEGVETEIINTWLYEMKCEKAQGYYYAKPQPFAEIMPGA